MTKEEARKRRRTEMLERIFMGATPEELAGDLRQAAFATALGLLNDSVQNHIGICDSDVRALFTLTTLVDQLYEIAEAEVEEDRAELSALRRAT